MRSLLLSAILLTSAAVMASSCWEAGADALYFRPVHCQASYAFKFDSGTTAHVDRESTHASHDWGYRLHVDYTHDCILVGLAYAHLSTTDRDKIGAGNSDLFLAFQTSAIAIDSARSSLDFCYQQVDLRGEYLVHNDCGLRYSVVGLARWVDVEMKSRACGFSSDVQPFVTHSSRFRGVGPGFGFRGDYCFPCNLRLGARFDLAALIGDRETGTFTNNFGTNGLVTSPESETTVLPNLSLAVHLNYVRQICWYLWTLEAGYEFNYFFDALYGPRPIDLANLPIYRCDNVGFAGPYIGLSVSF